LIQPQNNPKPNMKTTNPIGRSALFWSCAVFIVIMQFTAPAQTLVNRYSFSDAPGSTNVADSVGGQTGVLPNGGDFASVPGQLILLSSSNQYVQLPANILSNYTAVTVDCWATFATLPGACFLYGFGNTDPGGLGENYIFCQPENGRIAITGVDPGYTGEQGTGGAGNLSGQTVHVTSVYNPVAGYIELYTNGVLVSANNAVTVQMSSVSQVLNYIARSLYTPDSYMDVELNEFRLWNGALNGLQVAGCDVAGPDTVGSAANAGTVTSLQLSVPSFQLTQGGNESGTVLAQTTTLPYSVNITRLITLSSGNTNIITINSTNNAIQAVGQGSTTVTATYGSVSSTPVTITVVQPASILVHEYSFSDANGSSNVVDSVGGSIWNGTVMTTNGVSPGNFTGSQLLLTASNRSYVQLPAGIISNYNALTIEAWATFPDALPGNCFFFGFGNTDGGGAGEDYIYLQPSSGHIGITGVDPGYIGEAQAGGYGNLSTHTNIHIAAVFNPQANWIAVYTNGVLVGKNLAVTVQLAQVSSVLNYIARSLYTGDSYMDVNVDEFRIYNGALTSQGIAISDAAGPNSIPPAVTNGPGSLLSLSIQAPATLEPVQTGHVKLLANYTSLSNWDILGNSVFPPAGLTVSVSDSNVLAYANGIVTGVNAGTASIVTVYQGLTNRATVTVAQSPAPVLAHEYSFSDANGSTTVADSVGGPVWNGTVMSGTSTNAVAAPGAFTNGMLSLIATNPNFVKLPPGILSNYTALTIEGWVTAQTLPGNSMYYAFGNTDTNGLGANYLFGSLVRDYTAVTAVDPGYLAEQGTPAPNSSLALNTVIHFAGVYDPAAGYIALYTNGVLHSINNAVTDPLSVVSPIEAYIGKSVYNGDPYASLTLDEFRIYNGVLEPNDIKATQALGPNQVLSSVVNLGAAASGGNVVLSWPLTAGSFSLQSKASLTTPGGWTTITTPTAQIVGGQWQVTVPKTGGPMYFRLAR
jgi:hypothetical protein